MQSHLFIKIFFLNYLNLLARKLKCQVLSARKRITTKVLLMQVIDYVMGRNLGVFHTGKRLP